MKAVQEIVEAYGAAWNASDAETRRALLERAWADDGVYTDPNAQLVGREALLEYIAGFVARSPGARLILTSKVDEHHGLLRFTWCIVRADGLALRDGLDFGELAKDGRLCRVVGFFGPPPPVV